VKELKSEISDLRFDKSATEARPTADARRVAASPRVFVCLLLTAYCLLFAGCRQDMQDQPRYEAYESSKFFADGQSSRPYVEGTIPRGHLKDDKFFYQGKNAAGQPGAGGATQGLLQSSMANVQGGAIGAQPGGDVNARGNAGGRINTPASQTQTQAGKDDVTEFPFPITKDVLNRGQERYQIYCSMCHGMTGYGDGMIVRRGFRRPPSYHDDRLRSEPVGHFFDVITNGWGAMPDYAAQIPPEDRWAIIAYIRALQLSQQAPANGQQSQPGAQQTGSGGERH
jgi:mono/diheme cytochrome c family protein